MPINWKIDKITGKNAILTLGNAKFRGEIAKMGTEPCKIGEGKAFLMQWGQGRQKGRPGSLRIPGGKDGREIPGDLSGPMGLIGVTGGPLIESSTSAYTDIEMVGRAIAETLCPLTGVPTYPNGHHTRPELILI